MKAMNTLLVPFIEFKSLDEKGLFEGYGSTFGNVDLGNDVCAKGCFSRALKEHSKGGTLPSMYWLHSKSEPIGDWLEMSEDSKGLKCKGQLWIGRGIENAEKAYCMLKGTGSKGLSIGYGTRDSSYDPKTGVRTLKDVDLPEVSVVGYGMNPKALVTAVKSLEECTTEQDLIKAIEVLQGIVQKASFQLPDRLNICSKLNALQIRDGNGKYQTLDDYIRGRKDPNHKPITIG